MNVGQGLRLAVCLLSLASLMASDASADTSEQFVEGLKAKGLFDEALDYLERSRDDERAPESFRERIDLEIGMILIEQSRRLKDDAARETKLRQATEVLRKARLREERADRDSSAAAIQLAQAKTAIARLLAKRHEMPEAQLLYSQAVIALEDATLQLKDRLTKLPKFIDSRKEPEQAKQRDALRGRYLQAQILIPVTREEVADTWKDSDLERNALLKKAIADYNRIYNNYRVRLVGLYARFYEGRSLRKLGEHDASLSIMKEILEQPPSIPTFRTLRMKALAEALQCQADPSGATFTEVVALARKELKMMTPAEAASADGRLIKKHVAKIDR